MNKNDEPVPKTLLKSFKSSPTNQDRRENALNNQNKFTDKDLANQIQDVNLKANNNDKSGKNFSKQETGMSFGGFFDPNKDTNENQDSLRTINNDSKFFIKKKF